MLSTALFRASLRDVTVRTTGRPSLRMLSTTKSIWDTSTSNTTKSDTRPPYQPVLKKKKKAKGVKEELTPMQIMTRVGIATSILTVIGAGYYLGRPYEKDETFKESSDGLKGYYERAYERIDRLVQYYRAPAYEKMLPDPLEDDLQPMTLVMNLDETLIYSTWDYQHGWRIAKRPGVDYFLAYISQFFELVLITSQPQMNAEPIIHKLDPVGYMPYRFYREATRYVDGKHVKDLNHLNRNLAHVIIMDSNPDAYMLQPDNAIAVPPWQGDPNDRFLIDIIPFLQTIAETRPSDVRPILKQYQGKDIPKAFAASEQAALEQYQREWLEEQKKKSRGLNKWLGVGKVSGMSEEMPTELPYQRHRRLRRQLFEQQHEEEDRRFREQAKKAMQEQLEHFKKSNISILDYMTKGAPTLPPPSVDASTSSNASA